MSLNVMEHEHHALPRWHALEQRVGGIQQEPSFDVPPQIAEAALGPLDVEKDAAHPSLSELSVDGVHSHSSDPVVEPVGISEHVDSADDAAENVVHDVVMVGIRAEEPPNHAVHLTRETIEKECGSPGQIGT